RGGGRSPLQGVGHPALVPARIAEIVEESPGHLRVRGQAVLDQDAHSRMNLVGCVADLEVRLARDRLGQMYARRRRAPGVELPERFPRGPARAVQMIDELDDVVL